MTSTVRTARFRTVCPTCGDIDLGAEQMWLVRTDLPGDDHYGFWCSGCGGQVRRHANDAVIRILERCVPVDDNRHRPPRVLTS